MRRWTVLAIFLMSATFAHAGKYDYFECVDHDGAVSYSIARCNKGEKQTIIHSDEAPAASVPAYVPPPAPAKPVAAPDQSGKKDIPPVQPGTPSPAKPPAK